VILHGVHKIVYCYSEPVLPGHHLIRLKPRNTSAQHIQHFAITTTPASKGVEHILDEYNNEVISLWFDEPTHRLELQSEWTVQTHLQNPFAYLLAHPSQASNSAIPLAYTLAQNPHPQLQQLAQELLLQANHSQHYAQLLNEWLHKNITVGVRMQGDALLPIQTLQSQRGACRDIAVLMIELCRIANIPARFVSGYCYHGEEHIAHELHSWVELWLPHGGWRGYDPTLGINVADSHVALCSAPLASKTLPLEGGYSGQATANMTYSVVLELL
jgi:transglutaminase-like putative cysteine protease